MIKIDPTVKKETIYVATVSLILSLLMQGVFLISRHWDLTCVWGNVLGLVAAIGNFLLMGLTVQKALAKEEKDAKKIIKFSQSGRLFLLLLIALAGNFIPFTNLLTVAIPYIFPRIAVTLRPLIIKDKQRKE